MRANRYSVLLFDSSSNERYSVSLFATCMTNAAVKAKEALVKKGIVNSKNVCIRKIYTVS